MPCQGMQSKAASRRSGTELNDAGPMQVAGQHSMYEHEDRAAALTPKSGLSPCRPLASTDVRSPRPGKHPVNTASSGVIPVGRRLVEDRLDVGGVFPAIRGGPCGHFAGPPAQQGRPHR